MAQTTTLVLLPQTTFTGVIGQGINVIGDTKPAASFYLGNSDLQTVNIKLTAATGNIVIQGTLVTMPVNDDWFDVYTLEANVSANVNSTISTFANITGNFVHIRATVRDFSQGQIDHIKLSY